MIVVDALLGIRNDLACSRRALRMAASHPAVANVDLNELERGEAERVWVMRVQPLLGGDLGVAPATIDALEAVLDDVLAKVVG